MSAAANGRRCDNCTACCFTHAVTAIQKPGGEWCPHCEIGAGCRIYRERPEQCQEFSCLWLRGGWGNEQDRPDRLKVVVGDLAVKVGNRRIRLVQFIETDPGAMDQKRLAELIRMFRTEGVGICIARMLPSGRHADATYEIPGNLLAMGELDLFKQALAKLSPFE
jgi:Fe-S-cluster containining protein